jgi:hypothetical protein
MITKVQLKEDKDSQNRVKYQFDMPWDETSLARLYDKMDAAIEFGNLVDIVSAVPVLFNKENNTIRVEVVLDVSDIFEENPDEEDEQEEA